MRHAIAVRSCDTIYFTKCIPRECATPSHKKAHNQHPFRGGSARNGAQNSPEIRVGVGGSIVEERSRMVA